jgi:hypothetical protein
LKKEQIEKEKQLEEKVVINDPIWEIPDLTKEKECEKQELLYPYNNYFPWANNCNIDFIKKQYKKPLIILKNQITPKNLTWPIIANKSKIFIVKWEIDNIFMYIKASVTDKKYSEKRKNAIYFYINSGNNGWFLNSYRIDKSLSELSNIPKSIIIDNENYNKPWVFLSKDTPVEYVFDLKKTIWISNKKWFIWTKNINYFNNVIRKKWEKNYIYSYVSKMWFGKIDELSFLYSCKKNSDCKISLIN